MEKEFVPHEQALALEELGFDSKKFLSLIFVDDENKFYSPSGWIPNNAMWTPTFSQAFRFFREKYNLDGSMSVDVWNKKTTSYRITGGIKGIVEANSYGALYDIDSKDYDSYEEAELECLIKLIEIVKENKSL